MLSADEETGATGVAAMVTGCGIPTGAPPPPQPTIISSATPRCLAFIAVAPYPIRAALGETTSQGHTWRDGCGIPET